MTTQIGSLRERAFWLLGRAMARFDPSRLEAWVGLGLTITQLRVLFMLRDDDGAPAGLLAERLNVTPSTLTRIVDRLVRQGLVRRYTDDGDRRLVRHRLTADGLRTVEELERGGRAHMNEILGRLSPDQLERLVLGLEDLSGALDDWETRERAGGES